MYLLYTIFQVIAGCAFRVHEVLVSCILESAGLHHLEAEVDIPPLGTHLHRISQIQVRRTRCTDTIAFATHGDGMFAYTANLAPVRGITILILQTNLRIRRVVEVHVGGMVITFSGIGYYLILCIQGIGAETMVGMESEGMGIIHARRHFRWEDIVVFIALHGTYERVIWCGMEGSANQRNLQMRVVHRGEVFPCIFESIVRSTGLERDLHIEGIDDIHIFAAVRHVHRIVSGRGDGGGERTFVGSLGQTAESGSKAAIAYDIDRISRLPVIAVRDEVCDIVFILAAAIGQRIIEQHRVDAVSFIPRLNRGIGTGTVIAELQIVFIWISAVIEEVILLLQIRPGENRCFFFVSCQRE